MANSEMGGGAMSTAVREDDFEGEDSFSDLEDDPQDTFDEDGSSEHLYSSRERSDEADSGT